MLPRTLAILSLLAGLVATPLTPASAQLAKSPAQELYVSAFLSARKAEELAAAGNSKAALEEYRRAAATLNQIKRDFPTWQKELLDFRIGRVNEAMQNLEAGANEKDQPPPAPPEPKNVPPPAAPPIIDPAQELFVGAFLSIRKAEELADTDAHAALIEFRSAAKVLNQIKQQFPNWQHELVDFRLERVKQAMQNLEAK